MGSLTKVALGIDVTDTHVNMVLLKKDRSRLTVLNAARVPLPEGTVENGHIVDSARLAKVLKAAKRHGRIGKSRVAVSLPGGSTLARIVPLDEDDPQRIAQFVAGEVQQYAALSGRETISDFRVLAPVRHDRLGRILIVASDSNAVSAVTQTCRNAGFRVSVVEPAIMACVRAQRLTIDPNPTRDNCLLALLKDNTLTVCVFLAGTLSFVRTKRHEFAEGQAQTLYSWIAEEINAVLRFCGIEPGHEPEGWRIIVADEDGACGNEDMEQSFQSKMASEAVEITTQARLPEDAVVTPRAKEGISTTAFGLALRLLDQVERSPGVNLVPAEDRGAKSTQRIVLLTSIAVALFTLVVLVGIGVLELMVKRVNQDIVAAKQADLERKERTLATAATELAFVDRRIGSLTGEYEYLKQIAESDRGVDWAQFLVDLKDAVPERLQIVELSTQDNSEMLVRGISYSYESVHTFAQMLTRSVYVSRASILQTTRDETRSGLVQYAIQCTLCPKETR